MSGETRKKRNCLGARRERILQDHIKAGWSDFSSRLDLAGLLAECRKQFSDWTITRSNVETALDALGFSMKARRKTAVETVPASVLLEVVRLVAKGAVDAQDQISRELMWYADDENFEEEVPLFEERAALNGKH